VYFFIKNCILAIGFSLISFKAFSQTSTTSMSPNQIGLQSLKERWGASYSNYMNGPNLQSSAGGGSINHYFSLKRKFNSNWSLAGVLRPDSNLNNGRQSTEMGDSYLKLDYPSIYKADESFVVTGDVRYYFPQSQDSKDANLAGSLVTRINVKKELKNLSLGYILIPKVYLNNEIKDGQNIFSHGHYLSMAYKLKDSVSFDFAIYPSWALKRNRSESFNNLPAYPGMTFQLNEQASISPYFEIPLMEARAKDSSVGAALSYVLL